MLFLVARKRNFIKDEDAIWAGAALKRLLNSLGLKSTPSKVQHFVVLFCDWFTYNYGCKLFLSKCNNLNIWIITENIYYVEKLERNRLFK